MTDDHECPSAAYLLGSMVEDDVDAQLALKIAETYADVRSEAFHEKTQKWLHAMLPNLGPIGSLPSTALAALAQPSTHLTNHYEALAVEAGWKEVADAEAAQPIH